jgi:hypothetical protein
MIFLVSSEFSAVLFLMARLAHNLQVGFYVLFSESFIRQVMALQFLESAASVALFSVNPKRFESLNLPSIGSHVCNVKRRKIRCRLTRFSASTLLRAVALSVPLRLPPLKTILDFASPQQQFLSRKTLRRFVFLSVNYDKIRSSNFWYA